MRPIVFFLLMLLPGLGAFAQSEPPPPTPAPPPPHPVGELTALPAGSWTISRSGQVYERDEDAGTISIWSKAGGTAAVNLAGVPVGYEFLDLNAGFAIFSADDAIRHSLVAVDIFSGNTTMLDLGTGAITAPSVEGGKIYFIGNETSGATAHIFSWAPGTVGVTAVSPPVFNALGGELSVAPDGSAFALAGNSFTGGPTPLPYYSLARGAITGPDGASTLNKALIGPDGSVTYSAQAGDFNTVEFWDPSLNFHQTLGVLPDGTIVSQFEMAGNGIVQAAGNDQVQWFNGQSIVETDAYFHSLLDAYQVEFSGVISQGSTANAVDAFVFRSNGQSYLVSAVPEPSTVGLAAIAGLILLGINLRARKPRSPCSLSQRGCG